MSYWKRVFKARLIFVGQQNLPGTQAGIRAWQGNDTFDASFLLLCLTIATPRQVVDGGLARLVSGVRARSPSADLPCPGFLYQVDRDVVQTADVMLAK